MITKLKKNEIFVFGSNEAGIHGGGAAHQAFKDFGAKWGVGFGLVNQTFAIPTKDKEIRTLPLNKIEEYINKFINFCSWHTKYKFLVTEIGCGLAGYEPKDIAPMFEKALGADNIILPERFKEILNVKLKEK